ncbi:MAG TPA: hypothetical protein ENK92_00255 [Bacteroidetes bacterium]|nr:hypothetical protein [Bacteroidota bacterium]
MKKSKFIVMALLIFAGIFAGCAFNPANSDRNAIEDLIDSETSWFKPDGHYGEEQLQPATLAAFDTVLFWFRYPDTTRSVNRTISVDILGDSAYVTISGTIPGILYLKGVRDTDTIVVNKQFLDRWEKSAIFKKDTIATYHRGWRLYALTGSEITTDQNDIAIDSVRLQLENTGLDTVITDIMTMVPKDSVIRVRPGDMANIIVYTNRDDAYAFLHSWFLRWHFVQDSANHRVYHGQWKTPVTLGVHRVVFDILSHASLADDSLPYDSNAWGLHYLVTEQ